MSFASAIRSGFANYVTFRGRASRSEYWWWALFTVIVQLVASAIHENVGNATSIEAAVIGADALPRAAASKDATRTVAMSCVPAATSTVTIALPA